MPVLRLGPYQLLNRLAAGGMGEVYVGVRTGIGQFEKPLAIKLLLPHLSEDQAAVDRFLDEARLSARMNHPNVAQVFDVGLVDERYFIAMELVRGASLSQLIKALKKERRLPSAAVVSWVGRSLCEGLHHAHTLTIRNEAQHVVHRDVTPHNVLVSTDGVVKLTDFGIARMRTQSASTGVGKVIGKLSYMPPEQLQGSVDARADVFGVGATLFHLATLERPFETETTNPDPIAGFHERRLRELSSLRPDLPARLVAAIEWALQPDRERRPSTVRELRDALPDAGSGHDELASLVSSVCRPTVEHVDEVTRRGTFDRTPEVPATGAFGTTAPPTSARPPIAAAAVVGTSIVAVAAALLWVSLPRPATPVSAPQARPSSVAPAAPAPSSKPTLEPAPSPPPAQDSASVQPSAPPTEPARARPIARPTPARLQPGFLFVTAEPWAYVFVDGRRLGETPLAAVPLPAGSHALRLVNPETKREHQETIVVREGRRVYAKAWLK